MSAAGKVCIGFSLPYVAKYSANGGSPTYSGGRKLARGVEVSIEPSSSSDNSFCCDNLVAETDAGIFTGGDLMLTVDGLLLEAEQMITGAPEPEEFSYGEGKKAKILKHGSKNNPPYFGVGYIAKYRSDGVDTFVPTILRKVRFDAPKSAAKTMEDCISWQTQALSGKLARDVSADHDWKWVVEDQATEEGAEEILKALLNVAAETEAQA